MSVAVSRCTLTLVGIPEHLTWILLLFYLCFVGIFSPIYCFFLRAHFMLTLELEVSLSLELVNE